MTIGPLIITAQPYNVRPTDTTAHEANRPSNANKNLITSIFGQSKAAGVYCWTRYGSSGEPWVTADG